MPPRYRIQFPKDALHTLAQDEVYFHVIDGDHRRRIRFHDYDAIYRHPGLYEQVFYDRLKCSSPRKVSDILRQTLEASHGNLTELRVLDLGAGNGMMGERLKQDGVARLVGADIISEAADAAFRDRPWLYDEYYVADFTNLDPETIEELQSWSFNCLTSVAALGFGDIPPAAFFQAMQLVETPGWVAFNIKESFLDRSDTTGFSRFIRELIFSEYLNLHHLERYRHRLSIDGTPLYYYAVVAQKTAPLPNDFLSQIELTGD